MITGNSLSDRYVRHEAGIGTEIALSESQCPVTWVDVSTSSEVVKEGETATYDVRLPPGLAAELVSVEPVSDDLGAVTVEISPDSMNHTTVRTVTITGVQDDDHDDETVTLTHGVEVRVNCGGGEPIEVTVPAPSVTVTVTDDDNRVASLALTPAPLIESGDPTVATVTATLNEAMESETWITVSAVAVAVAPATDTDFVLSRNKVLKIAPGATTSTGR